MCALSNSRSVSVITLGRMGFMAAYDVQTRFARQHLDELSGKPNAHGVNTLLLVEHTPVYTVGVRGKEFNKSIETDLKKTGAEFYKTNRGGLLTFHGPGQLVVYPILNLQLFKPSLKWYGCQLEQTMINTLKQFGLTGRTTDQTGIWVEDRKIGTIGLHESHFITTHGVSLNCNVDLDWFKHIAPYGHAGVEVTSLAKETKQNVDHKDVVKPFLRCFQDVFDCELEFKMLEEKELKSTYITRHAPTGKEFDAAPSVAGLSSRPKYTLRHLSTLSVAASPLGNLQSKNTPMW
uniref:lipoyl(octanoyl) transferase n=1 Tax=Arion vulgaris TaxID=1028688 RepID=A0A0B6ZM13_9EUPU